MGAPKGNKNGKTFSKSRQPTSRVGRKPTRMNQLFETFRIDNPERAVSKEDLYKLMGYLLTCTKTEIEALLRNPLLPIYTVNQIRSMLMDIANGKTDTGDKIFDRVYGKASQTVELTGAGGKPLIPSEPMSRKGYEELLNKLKCGG